MNKETKLSTKVYAYRRSYTMANKPILSTVYRQALMICMLLFTISILFWPRTAKAWDQNKTKHFAVSAAIAVATTKIAKETIAKDNNWGAFVTGALVTSMGGFVYEMAKPGPDSHQDMQANMLGAASGALLTVTIDF